jgi:hypothetical protein
MWGEKRSLRVSSSSHAIVQSMLGPAALWDVPFSTSALVGLGLGPGLGGPGAGTGTGGAGFAPGVARGGAESHLHHLDLAPLPFLVVFTTRRVLLVDAAGEVGTAGLLWDLPAGALGARYSGYGRFVHLKRCIARLVQAHEGGGLGTALREAGGGGGESGGGGEGAASGPGDLGRAIGDAVQLHLSLLRAPLSERMFVLDAHVTNVLGYVATLPATASVSAWRRFRGVCVGGANREGQGEGWWCRCVAWWLPAAR